eukprot:6174830-Pleurochrysis_carterae.AAC.2
MAAARRSAHRTTASFRGTSIRYGGLIVCLQIGLIVSRAGKTGYVTFAQRRKHSKGIQASNGNYSYMGIQYYNVYCRAAGSEEIGICISISVCMFNDTRHQCLSVSSHPLYYIN